MLLMIRLFERSWERSSPKEPKKTLMMLVQRQALRWRAAEDRWAEWLHLRMCLHFKFVSLGSIGPKKKILHFVLVNLVFILSFLTPSLKIQNKRHTDAATTWTAFMTYFPNLLNIQNHELGYMHLLCMCTRGGIFTSSQIAYKMCKGVKTDLQILCFTHGDLLQKVVQMSVLNCNGLEHSVFLGLHLVT